MSEIQKFLEISGTKKATAYVKGLKDPSPEFQIFLFLYMFSGGSDYVEDLTKVSTKTLEWLQGLDDGIDVYDYLCDSEWIFKLSEVLEKTPDAYIEYLNLLMTFDMTDDISLNLDGLSSTDALNVIAHVHKSDCHWSDELKWVAKQPESFQIEYVQKSKKFLNDYIFDMDYDGSLKPAANKLLIESLSPHSLLNIIISDSSNDKFKNKIPPPSYEKAVLDLIKSGVKCSLSISGNSAYNPSVVEFHKNPGIGLINAAMLKILSKSDQEKFLKTNPTISQSKKIKYANSVYINLNYKDMSIPLTNKKLIETVIMVKNIEM